MLRVTEEGEGEREASSGCGVVDPPRASPRYSEREKLLVFFSLPFTVDIALSYACSTAMELHTTLSWSKSLAITAGFVRFSREDLKN